MPAGETADERCATLPFRINALTLLAFGTWCRHQLLACGLQKLSQCLSSGFLKVKAPVEDRGISCGYGTKCSIDSQFVPPSFTVCQRPAKIVVFRVCCFSCLAFQLIKQALDQTKGIDASITGILDLEFAICDEVEAGEGCFEIQLIRHGKDVVAV